MSIQKTLYNALFKRSSTYALTILAGAFVFETAVDESSWLIFNKINQGKLWHHIEGNYAANQN